MGKKHKSKHKADGHLEHKLSKNLLPVERDEYKLMGVPDPTQNHLELFTDDTIHDIGAIIESCSDNQLKADYIVDELKSLGFRPSGLGTNILCMTNALYPGVVFKLALDMYGRADNLNDSWLSTVIPRYSKVYAVHKTGLVSVQERYVVVKDTKRLAGMQSEIYRTLSKLSEHFLIVDLSPNRMFLNYGIARDGGFVFLDGSDLYPISDDDEIRCTNPTGMKKHSHEFKRCGGKLEYDPDFSKLVCKKCYKEFNPLELRPKKEVRDMLFNTDGISTEERARLVREEEAALRRNQGIYEEPASAKESVFESPDEEGEDDGYRVIPAEEPPFTLQPVQEEAAEQVACTSGEDDQEEEDTDKQSEDDEPSDTVSQPTIQSDHSAGVINTEDTKSQEEHYNEDDDDEDDSFITLHTRVNESVTSTAYSSQTKVSEISEKNTSGMGDPCIHYTVVNEGEPSELNLDPGIYMDISGDLDEAYESCGLPIFITFDHSEEYTQLIKAPMLLSMIKNWIQIYREEGLL